MVYLLILKSTDPEYKSLREAIQVWADEQHNLTQILRGLAIWQRGLSSDELPSERLTWQKSSQVVIYTAQNWGQGPLRECNSSILLLQETWGRGVFKIADLSKWNRSWNRCFEELKLILLHFFFFFNTGKQYPFPWKQMMYGTVKISSSRAPAFSFLFLFPLVSRKKWRSGGQDFHE